MEAANHEFFEQIADRVLAGAASARDEEILGQHLADCARCKEYFDSGERVVGGLRGFSLTPDQALQARMRDSLRTHARQLEAQRLRRRRISRRMAWTWAAALFLAAAGSLADWRLASLLSSIFDLQLAQVRDGLLAGWILPSFAAALLMPLLIAPNRKGLSI
jgi:anti-sigma factor RsiW